jgi:uncharacterized membrane protein HdeD (DUF308 family)
MIGLVTGVLFLVIGMFISLRPLWTHNATLTSARWLDFTMAAVCLLRGVINIRTALARRRSMPA